MISFLFKLYRKIKIYPASCRFYPSCSSYAEEALKSYGLLWGGWLALRRLLRCNQLFAGGNDPLPAQIKVFGKIVPKKGV